MREGEECAGREESPLQEARRGVDSDCLREGVSQASARSICLALCGVPRATHYRTGLRRRISFPAVASLAPTALSAGAAAYE